MFFIGYCEGECEGVCECERMSVCCARESGCVRQCLWCVCCVRQCLRCVGGCGVYNYDECTFVYTICIV